jgi:hypothetical protein
MEKQNDIAKCLGLAPSTLNSTVVKKREIREQIDMCGKSCKKRKNGRESTFCILLTWYLRPQVLSIPVDGGICEKAKQIADRMQIDKFAASNGCIYRFKDGYGLVCKKLAGESITVNSDMRYLWLERLPPLLEGYEP